MTQAYKQDQGWIDFNNSLPDVLLSSTRVYHLKNKDVIPDEPFFDLSIDVVISYNDDTGSILLFQRLDNRPVIREILDLRNLNLIKTETFMWSRELYFNGNISHESYAIPTMSWEDIDKLNNPTAAKKKRHYAYDMAKGFK